MRLLAFCLAMCSSSITMAASPSTTVVETQAVHIEQFDAPAPLPAFSTDVSLAENNRRLVDARSQSYLIVQGSFPKSKLPLYRLVGRPTQLIVDGQVLTGEVISYSFEGDGRNQNDVIVVARIHSSELGQPRGGKTETLSIRFN